MVSPGDTYHCRSSTWVIPSPMSARRKGIVLVGVSSVSMAVDLKRWDVFDWIVPKVKNYSSGESNKIVNRLLEFKGIDRDEMCVHAKKDRRKSGELLDSLGAKHRY